MTAEKTSDPPFSPPPGPPWDLPLDEAPFAFLDLEMTGLDVARDRVVEVCIEIVRGGRLLDRLHTLICPPSGAGGNAHIHGLDAAALAGAPSFCAIAARVRTLCTENIVVAHGAAWDVAFLEAELERCGQRIRIPHFIDTLSLSRRAFALPSHSLASVARSLGVVQEQAHRAGDDVRVLRRVFEAVRPILAPRSPRDLWHVRVGERRARPEVVAASVLAAEQGGEVVIAYRPSRKPVRRVTGIITGVRTDLDPPRVLGYALPGRGRFDFRADRILSVASAAIHENEPIPL